MKVKKYKIIRVNEKACLVKYFYITFIRNLTLISNVWEKFSRFFTNQIAFDIVQSIKNSLLCMRFASLRILVTSINFPDN